MGLFDFDGDGKISPWEDFLEYSLFEEFANDGTGEPGIGLFADDHKDDWRYDCEDGSEYDIDPWDYDTLEEYEEALEDARLDRDLYGEDEEEHKADEDGETEEDEDDEDEFDVPEEPKRWDYPNRRRYEAAENLVRLRGCRDGAGEIEKARERCRFILEKSDTVTAADYLTWDGDFIFAQAVKDHFELPCSLPDQDKEMNFTLVDVLEKLARYDVPLSLEVWDWCIDNFAEYRFYSSCGFGYGFLTDSVVRFLHKFPEDYRFAVVRHIMDRPKLLDDIITIGEEANAGYWELSSAALKLGQTDFAERLFRKGLELAKNDWKEVIYMTNEMIWSCKEDGLQVMEHFRDNMFPRIKAINDGMVQDEVPQWEEDIAAYCKRQEYDEPSGIFSDDDLPEEVCDDAEEEGYLYCQVALPGILRTYSYITDDETLEAGDRVVVPFGKYDIEKTGTVVKLQRYIKHTPYPLEKTKRVLRRAKENKMDKEESREAPVEMNEEKMPETGINVSRLIEWLEVHGSTAEEILDCLKTVL